MNGNAKRGGNRPQIKRGTFTFRVSEPLREKLSAAAKAAGKPVSEEIEMRLEQSFRDVLAGDGPTARLLRAIANAIETFEAALGSKWWENEVTGQLAYRTASEILKGTMGLGSDEVEDAEPMNLLTQSATKNLEQSSLERQIAENYIEETVAGIYNWIIEHYPYVAERAPPESSVPIDTGTGKS